MPISDWFRKDWTTRRDETIEFIRTAHVGANANRRQLIADVLKYRHTITQAISRGMSYGYYSKLFKSRATITAIKSARSYRRACIAIRCAILGQTIPNATTAVALHADAALPGELGNLLGQAYTHETNWLQNELTDLRTNPNNFLANKRLCIQGGPASGNINYVFFYDHETDTYRFKPPVMLTHGEMTVGGGMRLHRVPHILPQLYHVRVQKYTDIQANLGAIVGDLIAGPTFMITEELSGCSFMYQTVGVNMTAIHVLPSGPVGGPGRGYNLANTMRGGAVAFGNANNVGAIEVFGAELVENRPLGYDPAGAVDIVGTIIGGVWQIWAQARNKYVSPQVITGHWQVH